MSIVSAIVVFLLVWCVVLLMVLPLGVRGQAEENNIVRGTEPGAPVDSQMKRKALLTTLITFVIWAIICGIIVSGIVELPKFKGY